MIKNFKLAVCKTLFLRMYELKSRESFKSLDFDSFNTGDIEKALQD